MSAPIDLAAVERALHDQVAFEILLRTAPLERDQDVFDAGFDSLSLSRLLVFIEQRFGLSIPDEEVVVDEIASIAKMTRFVATRLEAKTSSA